MAKQDGNIFELVDDHLVLRSSGDNTPGTLTEKMVEGSNISLESITESDIEKIKINTYSDLSALNIRYASVTGSKIYKIEPDGTEIAITTTSRNWKGICQGADGYIYAVVANGLIYKIEPDGTETTFTTTSRNWKGICQGCDGYLYAIVDGGFIYKISNSGTETQLTSISRSWWGLCQGSDDNLYGVVNSGENGYVYKISLAGDETAITSSARSWSAICQGYDGNLYGSMYQGSIYKIDLNGTITALNTSGNQWYGITQGSDKKLYGSVNNGFIYSISLDGVETAITSTNRGWYGICQVNVVQPVIKSVFDSIINIIPDGPTGPTGPTGQSITGPTGGSDHLVISEFGDTVAGTLADKIVNGHNVVVNTIPISANEYKLQINAIDPIYSYTFTASSSSPYVCLLKLTNVGGYARGSFYLLEGENQSTYRTSTYNFTFRWNTTGTAFYQKRISGYTTPNDGIFPISAVSDDTYTYIIFNTNYTTVYNGLIHWISIDTDQCIVYGPTAFVFFTDAQVTAMTTKALDVNIIGATGPTGPTGVSGQSITGPTGPTGTFNGITASTSGQYTYTASSTSPYVALLKLTKTGGYARGSFYLLEGHNQSTNRISTYNFAFRWNTAGSSLYQASLSGYTKPKTSICPIYVVYNDTFAYVMLNTNYTTAYNGLIHWISIDTDKCIVYGPTAFDFFTDAQVTAMSQVTLNADMNNICSGTSNQFLKGDGSFDSNIYLYREANSNSFVKYWVGALADMPISSTTICFCY